MSDESVPNNCLCPAHGHIEVLLSGGWRVYADLTIPGDLLAFAPGVNPALKLVASEGYPVGEIRSGV